MKTLFVCVFVLFSLNSMAQGISPQFDALVKAKIIHPAKGAPKVVTDAFKDYSKAMSKKKYTAWNYLACLGFLTQTGIEMMIKRNGRYPRSDSVFHAQRLAGLKCAATKPSLAQLKKKCTKYGGDIVKRKFTGVLFCTSNKPDRLKKVIDPTEKVWTKVIANMYAKDYDVNDFYSWIFTSMGCGTVAQYDKIFNTQAKAQLYRWKYTTIMQQCSNCIQCRKAFNKRIGTKDNFLPDLAKGL